MREQMRRCIRISESERRGDDQVMDYETFLEELIRAIPERESLGVEKEYVKFYPDGYSAKDLEELQFIRDTNLKYHKKEFDVLIGDFVLLYLDEKRTGQCRFECKCMYDIYKEKGWKEIWKIFQDNVDTCNRVRNTGVVELLENRDYEALRDKLIIRPINYQKNKYDLKECIYRQVGDIALVLYVLLDDRRIGGRHDVTSAKMKKSVTDTWGLTEDEIFDRALGNTYVMAPPRMYFNPMDMKNPPYEKGAFMALNSPIREILPSQSPAVTTTNQMNGAIALFYPGVKERIAQMIGGDFYVAFTSMHEAKLHKAGTIAPIEIVRRLKGVNRSFAEDALTAKVYLYKQESGWFGVKEI